MPFREPDYCINADGLPNILTDKKTKLKKSNEKTATKIPQSKYSCRNYSHNVSHIAKMSSQKQVVPCDDISSIERKNIANHTIKQNLMKNKWNKDFINSQLNKNGSSSANKIFDDGSQVTTNFATTNLSAISPIFRNTRPSYTPLSTTRNSLSSDKNKCNQFSKR